MDELAGPAYLKLSGVADQFAEHPANELADLCTDLRSARMVNLRLPSPETLKALAVPFDDSLRFDDEQSRSPIRPFGIRL